MRLPNRLRQRVITSIVNQIKTASMKITIIEINSIKQGGNLFVKAMVRGHDEEVSNEDLKEPFMMAVSEYLLDHGDFEVEPEISLLNFDGGGFTVNYASGGRLEIVALLKVDPPIFDHELRR